MRSIPGKLAGSRALIFCGAILILSVSAATAETHRARHRKHTTFSVTLEPFKLTRSIVHAAAAPIVHNAPRVLAATAVAPIKLAYYAPRHLRTRTPGGE